MSFERRKARVGKVVSDKMGKTVVVLVEWRRTHRLYKKAIRRATRFMVHDEANSCNVGDMVRIIETRPLSKTKRWRVAEILSRGDIAEVQPEEIGVEEAVAAFAEPEGVKEEKPLRRRRAKAAVGEAAVGEAAVEEAAVVGEAPAEEVKEEKPARRRRAKAAVEETAVEEEAEAPEAAVVEEAPAEEVKEEKPARRRRAKAAVEETAVEEEEGAPEAAVVEEAPAEEVKEEKPARRRRAKAAVEETAVEEEAEVPEAAEREEVDAEPRQAVSESDSEEGKG